MTQNREQEIIAAFDAYCSVTGLAHATVGTRVNRDGKMYDRLKKGNGSCRMDTYEKVMRWFHDNMPAKLNGHRRKRVKQ